MTPRPNVSEERKKQIIDAAMNVFSRLGFHQARMDDIVEESGLSKGTLYWYFKSKDDIIFSILGSLFEGELEELGRMQTMQGTASQRIELFLHSMLKDIKKMLILRPLFYEFYALALRDKNIRKLLTSYLRSYMKALVPVIQQGIDRGEFQQIDAQDAAIALGAVIEGTILLWVYDSELIDLDHHSNASFQLFLRGMQSK